MGLRGQRWLIWGIAVVLFVVLMVLTPAIKQSQSYHTFADRRNFFGAHPIPSVLSEDSSDGPFEGPSVGNLDCAVMYLRT